MMSDPDTVDRTIIEETTGKLVLLIQEDRSWDDPETMHRQLREKIKVYVRYLRSEEFVAEHGRSPKESVIRLVYSDPPGQNTVDFLDRVSYELSKLDIDFQHRLDWFSDMSADSPFTVHGWDMNPDRRRGPGRRPDPESKPQEPAADTSETPATEPETPVAEPPAASMGPPPSSEQPEPSVPSEPEQPEPTAKPEPTAEPEPKAPPDAGADPTPPDGLIPDTEIPEVEIPEAEGGDGGIREPEAPEVELPDAEIPKAEISEVEISKAEIPETEIPEPEIAEAEVPESEIPESETPESETPEAEVPDVPETPAGVAEIPADPIGETRGQGVESLDTEREDAELQDAELQEPEVQEIEPLEPEAETIDTQASQPVIADASEPESRPEPHGISGVTEGPQDLEPEELQLQAEELQTEDVQTGERQAEEPQTEEPQTEEPRTAELEPEVPIAEPPSEFLSDDSGYDLDVEGLTRGGSPDEVEAGADAEEEADITPPAGFAAEADSAAFEWPDVVGDPDIIDPDELEIESERPSPPMEAPGVEGPGPEVGVTGDDLPLIDAHSAFQNEAGRQEPDRLEPPESGVTGPGVAPDDGLDLQGEDAPQDGDAAGISPATPEGFASAPELDPAPADPPEKRSMWPEEEFGDVNLRSEPTRSSGATTDLDEFTKELAPGPKAARRSSSKKRSASKPRASQPDAKGRPGRGLLAALGAAIASAIGWPLLAIAAESPAGPLALVVGLFVGFNVRLRGGGGSFGYRLIAMIGTVLGCGLGGLLSAGAFLYRDRGLELAIEQFTAPEAALEALQAFYGIPDLGLCIAAVLLSALVAASGKRS